MPTQREEIITSVIAEQLRTPKNRKEVNLLSQIHMSRGAMYPGDLRFPRRTDALFIIPTASGRSFILPCEWNRGNAANGHKRQSLLDTHLRERCDRAWGARNFLIVMSAGLYSSPHRSQVYSELSRYFKPNPQYNLWVIPYSEIDMDEDPKMIGNFIGNTMRPLVRTIMGLR